MRVGLGQLGHTGRLSLRYDCCSAFSVLKCVWWRPTLQRTRRMHLFVYLNEATAWSRTVSLGEEAPKPLEAVSSPRRVREKKKKQHTHTLQQLCLYAEPSFFFFLSINSQLGVRSLSIRMLPGSRLRPLGIAGRFVCWTLSWFFEVLEASQDVEIF